MGHTKHIWIRRMPLPCLIKPVSLTWYMFKPLACTAGLYLATSKIVPSSLREYAYVQMSCKWYTDVWHDLAPVSIFAMKNLKYASETKNMNKQYLLLVCSDLHLDIFAKNINHFVLIYYFPSKMVKTILVHILCSQILVLHANTCHLLPS